MYVNHFPVQFHECEGKNTKNEERRGCKTQKRTTPKRKNESKNTTTPHTHPTRRHKRNVSLQRLSIDLILSIENHNVIAKPQAKNEKTCATFEKSKATLDTRTRYHDHLCLVIFLSAARAAGKKMLL